MKTPIPITKAEKVRGYWEGFSPKLKRDVFFTSDLEYDYWLWVETDPNIISFCERPRKVSDLIGSKTMESVMSMWIKYHDQSEHYIKVKPSYVRNPILSKKLDKEIQIEQKWCEQNNANYKTVEEESIRSNPLLLSNKKLLISFVCNRSQPIDTDYLRIKKFISSGRYSLQDIHLHFADKIAPARITEALCWMIYQGKVQSNLDIVPLGSRMEVWLHD
ncbi:hypothetical protein FE782_11125 [Paenibacillus antri]|uniref:TnsA endonuclease C-terminal domain-containing protein n=1 Tax=Paenibacillus antri TaxID=2582848 RepID=A0A5R9G7W1_9BACL|nr:hypothetical protein [Paenibacillus antri]TLS52502.1 hypothetical protein FE782_11125 [Paenibacillus antri]